MSNGRTFGGKGRNAVKWSLLEKLLKRGVTFVVSMFLARLLEPSDFGLLAMISVFTAFAGVFADLGFGQALVQKKEVSQIQYNTVFYINILLGFIIYGAMWITAPYISSFFKEPILIPIIRVSSLSFIINSFSIVNSAILFKQLRLKVFTIVMFFSSLLSGAMGVAAAYQGFGVWSLVIYGLSASIIRVTMLWFMCEWKPGLEFNFMSAKGIWIKGLSFLNIGVINEVVDRLDNLIIGKIFNVSSLGLYNRAKSLHELPIYTFVVPITRPFFPMFSELQENPIKQKELFYRTFEMLNFLVILGFGLMFVLADNWITILYSDKWIGSVPFFKILILLIPMAPFNLLSTSLFKGTGKLKLLTFITVLDRLSIFFAIFFALNFGLTQYLYAFVSFKIFVSLFRVVFVQKYLKINAVVIFGSIIKMIVIFGVVVIPVEMMFKIDNIYIETVVKSLLFVSGYVLISYIFKVEGFVLFKQEMFRYLKISK